jgi:hypothetical protein
MSASTVRDTRSAYPAEDAYGDLSKQSNHPNPPTMKASKLILTLLATHCIAALASTPEQDKAFTEAYKKALETNDNQYLVSCLYTKGADEDLIKFFTLMQASDLGQTIAKVELIAMTKEEIAAFEKPRAMPGGKSYKMPFLPSKKLIVSMSTKDANGSSSSNSESAVAEHDGKLVIPVPVPVK